MRKPKAFNSTAADRAEASWRSSYGQAYDINALNDAGRQDIHRSA